MGLKANKTILRRKSINMKTKNWKLLFKGDRRKTMETSEWKSVLWKNIEWSNIHVIGVPR